MDIQEAEIAAMGRAELEELIDRAVRPDVPLRVLFAALDRYTELLRPPVVEEEAGDAEPTAMAAPGVLAAMGAQGTQGAQGAQGAQGHGLPGPGAPG
ncbi:hypothetical protein [Catenulispora subtropica]|uniref:Uncharacterized protein n=1 Tax=Catenulispora subtropica TaxID=450798 RepID=A0ABP5EJK2_9ACTN